MHSTAGACRHCVVGHRGRRLGVEIKFSAAPRPARGFWQAVGDLRLDRAVVVAPVTRRYPIANGVEVVPVGAIDEVTSGLATAPGQAIV